MGLPEPPSIVKNRHDRLDRLPLCFASAAAVAAIRVYFSGPTFLILAEISLDRGVPPPS